MSVATATVTATSKPSAIATLFPGYFALVMATGIVSIAAHFLGMEPIAQGLLLFNVAAYIVLWVLTIMRFAKYRPLFMADLVSHGRSVLFLTIVAGTCVLGNQFAILTPNLLSIAAALWVFGLALWLILIYTFFAVVTVREPKPAFESVINGSWLLVVVSTESICVLGTLIATWLGNAQVVLLISLAMYLIGALLYIPLITLILYRWMFFSMKPTELTPPYWINMGALAISTLAGSRLLLAAKDWDFLQGVAPFIQGLTLLYWCMATWWIPLLIIVGIWRHVIQHVLLRYDPQYWAMVFPLGMYTVATFIMIKATNLTMLSLIPQIFVFVALLAWSLTFLGLARQLLSSLARSHVTERNAV
jgi:tellurite resistance protein TehA-like permease